MEDLKNKTVVLIPVKEYEELKKAKDIITKSPYITSNIKLNKSFPFDINIEYKALKTQETIDKLIKECEMQKKYNIAMEDYLCRYEKRNLFQRIFNLKVKDKIID